MEPASHSFDIVRPRPASAHILVGGRGGDAAAVVTAWASRQGIEVVDQIWAVGQPRVTIDMVRTFGRDLALRPLAGEIRLGVFPQAHHLTPDASHALLKLLEDPPAHAMIVLGVEQEDQLLGTIVSRCQRWHLPNPTSDLRPPTSEGFATVEQIRHMTYRERLKLAERWAKTDDWHTYLQAVVRDARDLFHRGQLPAALVERLLGYEQLLATNVTPRLLLENALLALGKEMA